MPLDTQRFRPGAVRLNAAQLKWIAIICMIINHIGAGFLRFGDATVFGRNLELFYEIGRPTFVIFAYLLTEGYIHTRSKAKYLRNLAIFALVSEVPFNLCFYGMWLMPLHQNVFITLTLGLVALWAIDSAVDALRLTTLMRTSPLIATIAASLVATIIATVVAVIADATYSDYGANGIAAIVIIGVGRRLIAVAGARWPVAFIERPWLNTLLTVVVVEVAFVFQWTHPLTHLGVVLIALYDGTRGKQSKWLFYIIYPAHLLIITLAVAGWAAATGTPSVY